MAIQGIVRSFFVWKFIILWLYSPIHTGCNIAHRSHIAKNSKLCKKTSWFNAFFIRSSTKTFSTRLQFLIPSLKSCEMVYKLLILAIIKFGRWNKVSNFANSISHLNIPSKRAKISYFVDSFHMVHWNWYDIKKWRSWVNFNSHNILQLLFCTN